MRITVRTEGLDDLRNDLRTAPTRVHRNVVKAATVNAHRIRDTARQIISGHAHLPHYPSSITYDVTDRGVGGGALEEIGPDKGRSQGPLGNIAEYGTSNNAPIPHLSPALDAQLPDLERGLAKAAADALEGR